MITINTMTLDLAINTSEATAGERFGVHVAALSAVLLTFGLLGWPLLRDSLAALRRRRLTIEAMFLVGVVGALVASLTAMAGRSGAVYFEVSSLLLVVYSLGQQLNRSAQRRALRSIDAWSPAVTKCEAFDSAGVAQTKPVAELLVGDLVVVQPGSMIPVDGVVERGEAFVREAEMTGEALANPRRPGDQVWAGTFALDGALVVRCMAAAGARRIDAIVRAVELARANPAQVQRQADRLIAWFLPLVCALALITCAFWAARDGWLVGLYNAMAVLLIACPCALGLATPIAVWRAIGHLAARGLVVRGGETIEKLAAVNTVVFDKTGTVTEIEPRLDRLLVDSQQPLRAMQVRSLLATIERGNSHPLADAFARPAHEDDRGWELLRSRLLPATGIEAEVRRTGDRRPLVVTMGAPERLVVTADQQRDWRRLLAGQEIETAARVVAVLVDHQVVAAAVVSERARDGWSPMRGLLAELGVEVALMTGDSSERAGAVLPAGSQAGLTANDKLERVRALRAAGRYVLFVGDGVNDAAAMAASDVSVAVGNGADLACEVADVTWVGTDLTAFAGALSVARRSSAGIRSNLAIAAAYNLVGVAFAAGGLLHPVVAAVLMTCSSLVVTWRAAGFARGEMDDERRQVDAVAEGVA